MSLNLCLKSEKQNKTNLSNRPSFFDMESWKPNYHQSAYSLIEIYTYLCSSVYWNVMYHVKIRVLRLQAGHKYCLLGRLSSEVGWNHYDTIKVRHWNCLNNGLIPPFRMVSIHKPIAIFSKAPTHSMLFNLTHLRIFVFGYVWFSFFWWSR